MSESDWGTAAPSARRTAAARALWSAAMRLQGDQGARARFAAHPEWLTEVEIDGPPPRDVDDAEDYRRTVIGG